MKKIFKFHSFVFVVLLLAGCTSQKKLTYFNGIDKNAADSINFQSSFRHEGIIVSGDMLGITVSGLDPKSVAIFNLPFVSFSSPGSDQIYAAQTLQPYVVDIDGNINFPVIGQLKAEGLSRSQLVNLITNEIKTYVQNPIVNIRFMNSTVTVLGEVNKPGQFTFINERTTLLDALGLAGDLTAYGKRENVLIRRENNGKVEFSRLNLNDGSVFSSPYYYIQQNDFIYVEPNSVKSVSSQNIPLYLSSVSTLATLVTLVYSIAQANKN